MTHSIIKKTLKNGSKLLAISVPNSSSVFFSSVVRAGEYFAPHGKWELPHLLEHLVFLGNEKYPSQSDFMFEIEKNGAHQNATTGVILVRYYYLTGRKELFDIIPLGLAQLNKPLFRADDVIAEKEVVRNELQRRYDRYNYLVTDANEMKINRRLKTNSEQIASLARISREDILDFYEKTHSAKNTHFIVAGELTKVDVDRVAKLIEEGLENYPLGKKIEDPEFLWGDYQGKITVIERKEARQDYFCFYLVSDCYKESDIPAMRVLHAMYNVGLYSRLPMQARKLGLSYSVSTGISTNPQLCKIYIEDQVHPKNTLSLFEECLKQLKELQQGNFTEAELERAKGFLRGSYETRYQLPSHFVSWYEYDYIMRGKLKAIDKFLESLDAVSAQDVVRVAKRLIKRDQWTLAILGKDIGKKKKEFQLIIDGFFES